MHSWFQLTKSYVQFFVIKACGCSSIASKVENLIKIVRTLIFVKFLRYQIEWIVGIYVSWTLSQFNSRNSFQEILDIFSRCTQSLIHLFCVAWSLNISFFERFGNHVVCKHNQKDVASVHYIKVYVKWVLKIDFCLCRNLRCEFTLLITFKFFNSPERLPSKIHLRYFTFGCCLISVPLYTIFKDFEIYV